MEKKEPIIPDHSASDLKAFAQKLLVLSAFIGGAYILWLLSPVLTVVFFSGFLTMLFSPLIDSMNRKKIPDWIAIILIFLGVLLFVFVALFAIIPIFIEQIGRLADNVVATLRNMESLYRSGGIGAIGLPSFLGTYLSNVDFGTFFAFVQGNIASIGTVAANVSKNLLQGSTSLVSSISLGIFQIVMIGVFTFFMSLERRSIKAFIYEASPEKVREYLAKREDVFLGVLSAWIKGQAMLGLAIFALTLVGLFGLGLFGIKLENIFTLALIAGLMEFIPYIGPFLALLPALAIAASMGATPIIAVLILYILIQQAENNILVPMVMSKALDLSPLFILLVMAAMGSLLGVVGILLAIPFAAILQIVVKDLLVWRNREEKRGNLTKKGKRI